MAEPSVRKSARPRRSQPWRDRVVVVTGATSGIGAALCRALGRQGATVVGTGRHQERLRDLGRELPLALSCDVTSDHEVRLLDWTVRERFGRLDVLVNNAGIARFGLWDRLTIRDFQDVMAVNLLGVVRVTRALLPLIIDTARVGPAPPPTRGAVVNIASVAGRRGFPRHGAYGASKHALLGWSASLREELSRDGPAVVDICPPAVRTPFFENAGWPGFAQDHPGLRFMSPEEVARRTLRAVTCGQRVHVLGLRARLLDTVSRLAPGAVPALREARDDARRRLRRER